MLGRVAMHGLALAVAAGCVVPDFEVLPPKEALSRRLAEQGFVLLRGGNLTSSPSRLEAWASELGEIMDYQTGYNARKALDRHASRVYSTGVEPPEVAIRPHNEMSYSVTLPRIFVAGAFAIGNLSGGATTIVRNRDVAARLPSSMLARLRYPGMKYRIRYVDARAPRGGSAGTTWQAAFHTEDLALVRERCAATGRACSVRADRSVDAEHVLGGYVTTHDFEGKRGAELFFPCISCLGGRWESPWLGDVPAADRPFFTTWGDGTPFSEEEELAMEAAIDANARRICWQRGDVAVLDNLRISHGREAYSGERKLGVVLVERLQRNGDGRISRVRGGGVWAEDFSRAAASDASPVAAPGVSVEL